jgi:hypothetical protein
MPAGTLAVDKEILKALEDTRVSSFARISYGVQAPVFLLAKFTFQFSLPQVRKAKQS